MLLRAILCAATAAAAAATPRRGTLRPPPWPAAALLWPPPLGGRGYRACTARHRPLDSKRGAALYVVARNRGSASERADRSSEARYTCPNCSGQIRDQLLRQHMVRCCPDQVAAVLAAHAGRWPPAAVAAALGAAREAELLEGAVRLRFIEPAARAAAEAGEEEFDEAALPGGVLPGAPSLSEVGLQLGLPEARVAELLKKASAACPLVGDPEPLAVIYEDDELLVVDKPPGLRAQPIHRFRGGSLVNRGVTHLRGVVPRVVHRLDQDTSGITLFGKTGKAAGAVALQFRQHVVSKEYLALVALPPEISARGIVDGVPLAEGVSWAAGAAFEVHAPIARHPTDGVRRCVAPHGLPARTQFAVLVASPRGALILCRPHTGRTHQIRLHLAHAGCPILGDGQYAADASVHPIQRQALHAARLSLRHPSSGEPMVLSAPLPADMRAAAVACGLGGFDEAVQQTRAWS